MKSIEEIDSNLKVQTKIQEKDIKFYNIQNEPFDLYGFYSADENGFLRIPKEIAAKTNEGVSVLYSNTAGGRVRFKTNSPYIAISVRMPNITRFSHMPLTGSAGFDMYAVEADGYKYIQSFIPPADIDGGYESAAYFGSADMRDITINFPLYSDVEKVYIGISEKSSLACGGKYINKKPVVYYGSSITQGGCASRPGNSYQAIVSRRLNCDYINLGFSGSARAEKSIAEYIAGLDMSCFVYDYDHNAPDAEYLFKTHEPMFETVRKANPDLPVIMMSRPEYNQKNEDAVKRRSIILDTYENAVRGGDKNVYFVDGMTMYSFGGDSCTVDGIHPNDLGFMGMAQSLLKVLEKIELY